MTTKGTQERAAGRRVGMLVMSSLLLIFAITVFPFDFSDEAVSRSLAKFLNPSLKNIGPLHDVLQNLLLFLPLGFSQAGLLGHRGVRIVPALGVVTATSCVLSFSMELAQLFLPARISSLFDVISNTFSGLVGAVVYLHWGPTLLRKATDFATRCGRFMTIEVLSVAFAVYLLIMLFASIPIQRLSSVGKWDHGYPLVFGGEATGNHQWQGRIQSVVFFNRALDINEAAELLTRSEGSLHSTADVLGDYQLDEEGFLSDRVGTLPRLRWKSRHTPGSSDIRRGYWETESPPSFLANRIGATGKFSIVVRLATADISQSEYSRVLSYSRDPYNRNFYFAQEKTHLVFRFRTNGIQDANQPKLVLRDALPDTLDHTCVITFDGSRFRSFIDNAENDYAFEYGPGFALFSQVFPFSERINIRSILPGLFKALYYFVIFAPLGVILGRLSMLLSRRLPIQVLTSLVCVTCPAIMVEGVLTSVSGRGMDEHNIAFGIAITLVTMLIVRIRTSSRQKTAFPKP